MSQPAPTITTAPVDAEADVKAMAAEIQQKLAKYDQLEQEISKLTQEQATLESYVTNLMASNVRAHKPVNYSEQTFDVSDDSDFEQPSPSAKAPPKKRGRQPKAATDSTEPKAAPAKKKAKQGDSSDEGSEDDHEPQQREGTAETEQISSSPVRRPTEAADEGDRSPPSSRAAPATVKRGTRKVRDDSDSDEEFDQDSGSESDYGDKEVVGKGKKAAETAKPKPTAAAAKTATSRVKKATAPAAKKTAATTTPVKKAAPAIARPALKKSASSQLGSLLKSQSRPTSPKAARPPLTSAGSSGSLSLQMSPGSVRRTGVRGGSGVSSLKSLLGGSTVPRAGLSRRVLPKK
ncbi:hypothetical protein GGI17_002872 [Coemansia sp. S146]|nr:hypothetical protein GGI17_002872 [Coemansia sp. S146]